MAEEKTSRIVQIAMESAQAFIPDDRVLAAMQVVLKGSLKSGATAGAVGGLLGGALFGKGKKGKQAKLAGFEQQTILAITPDKVYSFAWGLGGKAKRLLNSWDRSAISVSKAGERRAAILLTFTVPDGNSVQLETLGRNPHIERAVDLLTGST